MRAPDTPGSLGPADHGDALFMRLVAEARALVQDRQFASAAALLARAADGVAPPAGNDGSPDLLARDALPAVQAVRAVHRAIEAYARDLDPPASGRVLRDLMDHYARTPEGALRDPTPDEVGHATIVRARERYLDGRRFAYTAAERYAYLDFLVGFAGAAAATRRPELARRILEPALDVARRSAEADDDFAGEASLFLIFARVAAAAGASADAYLAAESVRRRSADAPGGAGWRAPARVALGMARLALGERDEGRRLLRAALAELPASDHLDARVDGLRGLYEADLDAFDAEGALACHDALAAVGEAAGTSRREVEARAAERADPEDAIRRYRELLDDPATRAPGGAVTPDTGWRLLLRLGRLALDRGYWQAAYELFDAYYRPLLDARERDHPSASALDELLADVELAARRPQFAVACLSRATVRDSRLASRQLGASTSRRRRVLLAGARRRADALVALAAEFTHDDPQAVGGAFAVVTQRKGLNTNIERQAARDVAERAARDPDVAALSGRLAAVRAAVTRLALQLTRDASGGDASGDVAPGDVARLDALAGEEEALDAELLFRAGGVAVQAAAEAPNPLSVSMCVPEGAVYVEYVRHQPPRWPGDAAARPARYAAFVIPSRTTDWRLVDLGEAEPVDDLVARFRAGVTGDLEAVRDAVLDPEDAHEGRGGIDDGPASVGTRLRERIFDPLVAMFGGRTRLVVSPDGPLWALPLECLPGDAGGDLIEQYCVSYVSSAWSASMLNAERVARPPSPAESPPCAVAVVIGAPDYDLGAAGPAGSAFRFTPLPGTRAEAEAVAAAFGVEPALDASATAARLREAHGPFAVHLATHGFALGASAAGGRLADAPLLRTGLAFAGANARPADGGDAGVLTADEVGSLDLRGTELVVLSACKTGLGEVDRGEGLASLARSFEAAGAERVVAGLWSVPDAETRDLMKAFYGRLTPERGVAVALHEAKLEMRRRHGDVRRWGAFVCIGQWGPIALRPSDPATPNT
ncbi:hypothetical protein tb265_43190 [Gemmatimonadetes bacterium T265]|nr:hypothetical protein tb265_43190 [Gemmatimonadetes bacterium T265]